MKKAGVSRGARVSFATLVGFLAGIGLCAGAVFMSTSNYVTFLNLPSFFIVIGGTFAAAFISYEPKYVWGAFKDGLSILFAHRDRVGPQPLAGDGNHGDARRLAAHEVVEANGAGAGDAHRRVLEEYLARQEARQPEQAEEHGGDDQDGQHRLDHRLPSAKTPQEITPPAA